MKRKWLWAALCLLALGSCSFRDGDSTPASVTLPDLAVTAQPVATPPPGSYYNLNTDVGLVLDEAGNFAMYSGENCVTGTYSVGADGLIFTSGGEEAEARMTGEGLVFEDMAGAFFPVGVAEGFSSLGLMRQRDREYTDNGDGTWRVCDYSLGLAFVYPTIMSAPEGLLPDAVVVWDGVDGYVTGRNVTADFSGDGNSFIGGYMEDKVLTDFRALYGAVGSYESMEVLDENITGRLASAEGTITGGEGDIYVKCIIYTSTYSDGTVNYICKCFFAPAGDTASFNALANSVVNMTAVRRK